MKTLLQTGACTRSEFPSGAWSSCKSENLQWLHTTANFGMSTTSKMRRINTLVRYNKKLLHRLVGILRHCFVGTSLPPIL